MTEAATARTRGRRLHHTMVVGSLLAATAVAAIASWWTASQSQALWQLSPTQYAALLVGLLAAAITGLVATFLRVTAWRRGAWTDRSLAPFRIGLYLLVLGTVAYLIWLQPFKAYTLALFWGVVAGLYSLLVGFGGRLASALPPRLLRGLDVVLCNVCLLALLAEGGLRVISMVRPSPLFAAQDMSVAGFLASNRQPPMHVHLGFACDSRGYYDARPPNGAPIVAIVGDSFGVGVVPHHFHYTTVAERELGATGRIYNVGVSAVGPAEYVRMLEEDVLPLEPRCVVVGLFVGNDVAEARRFRPKHPFLRQWFDRGNTLLWLVPSRLWRLSAERGRRGDGGVGVAPGQSGNEPVTQDEASLVARFPWLADATQERPSLSEEAFIEVEADRCRHICDPNDAGAYDSVFAALEELERTAGDVPFAVLLIPDEFQVDDALWPEVKRRLGRDDLERNRPQRLISAWLEDRGIPHLDLLPELRAVEPLTDGRRHVYHRRDTHWNRRGNEVAGAALARFVRPWLQ